MAFTKTKSANVLDAINFKAAIGRTTPTPDNLYLFIGKTSEWTDENNPDTPLSSITYQTTTRNNIVALKKISTNNICHLVPRYNWTSGTVYDEYSDTDTSLFTKEFYVLTSEYNVYKCIDNGGGAQSLVQPTGTATQTIATGDGYQWKFMYNLSIYVVDTFLTTDWLPVPTDSLKTSLQIAVENAATQTSTSPPQGHGFSAVNELGANRLLVTQTFNGSEDGVVPVNISYRQIGLLVNPKLENGSLATGSVYLVNSSPSDIDENSGEILFIENRTAISHIVSQAVTQQIILTF